MAERVQAARTDTPWERGLVEPGAVQATKEAEIG